MNTTQDRRKKQRRRFQAIKLHSEGLARAEIARRLGVTRQSVGRWVNLCQLEGKDALRRKRGRAGPKPKLKKQDWWWVYRQMNSWEMNPNFSDWTCSHVVKLIHKTFGVRYSVGHVARMLRKLVRKYGGSSPSSSGVQV